MAAASMAWRGNQNGVNIMAKASGNESNGKQSK